MQLNKTLALSVGLVFAALASAGTLSFTCDPNVTAATCNYLNTTIANNYSSAFTNANADIYIQYGTTLLGSNNTGAGNQVTYAQYAAALEAAAAASGNPVQAAAVASLTANAAADYSGGDVEVTSALASALGITGDVIGGLAGTTAGGAACSTPGSSGCYNGVITITNDFSTPLYYDNMGGPEPSDAYDYYAVVETETDQILGIGSCISTTTNPLSNSCGTNTPSAVDLFRYSGPGSLVLDSAFSTTPGAYFSYNGGTSNGANGFVYNTLDNGEGYAEFVSSCPGGPFSIQDAVACAGTDKGLTILNDGGAEVNILNAIGYDVPNTATSTPEPGTILLLGAGLVGVGAIKKLRHQ